MGSKGESIRDPGVTSGCRSRTRQLPDAEQATSRTRIHPASGEPARWRAPRLPPSCHATEPHLRVAKRILWLAFPAGALVVLAGGSRDSEHVADPTADPEPPVNRSAEVEALAVQWMALLKADDATAAISLISPNEATFPAGSGPADCYPGGRASIEHVREAVTASGPPVPARRTRGTGRRRRRLVRRAGDARLPQKAIPLRMTGVAVREEGRWRLVQVRLSAAVTGEALLVG